MKIVQKMVIDFFRSRSEYGSGGGSEGIEEAVPSSMGVAIDSSGYLFGVVVADERMGEGKAGQMANFMAWTGTKDERKETLRDARMSAIDARGVLCRKLTEATDLPLLAARFPDRA